MHPTMRCRYEGIQIALGAFMGAQNLYATEDNVNC
jgi:hypothetical protein